MRRLLTLISSIALVIAAGLPSYAAAPAAPTSVQVISNSTPSTAVGSASAKVSWVGSNTAVSYSVSAVDAASNAKTAGGTCVATACTAIVTQLTGGTEYSVKVTAVASDGTTTAATAVKFTAISVPGAPSALTSASVAGKASLTWTPGSNLGGVALTGYTVSEKDKKIADFTVSASTVNTTVDSVVVGESYIFRVSAVNSNGTSVYDEFTSVTITGAPAAALAPQAKVTGSTLSVTWVAPSSNGSDITGYKVYLVDPKGVDVDLPASAEATATSASISNLAAGRYRVQVIATNANGDGPRSPFSNEVLVGNGTQTNAPVFTPSTLVAMDIGSTQSLTVVAPSGGDVTITVTSSPNGACEYSAGVITAVSAGSCTISAVAAGNSTYATGEGSKSVTVKSRQSIVFSPIAQQTMPGPFTLSATATSGLAVRYAATGSCTVSAKIVTFIGAGTCNIMASQPGNSAYSAAASVPQSFTIAAAPGGGTGAGGGNAGGGSGGGGGSAPTPTTTPSPTVSPSPKPTTTPSPVTQPKPVKVTDSASVSNSLVNATVLAITGTKVTTAIKLGKSVAAKLTSIPAGTKVTSTLKNAKGQVFALPTKTVGNSKTYRSAAVKPKVKGTYTITITYGKVKKTLVIVVK